jgi:hypothetical protein
MTLSITFSAPFVWGKMLYLLVGLTTGELGKGFANATF